MKVACGRTSGQRFPSSGSALGAQLQNVAATFVDLQELRHDADYDNSRAWTRTEVLEDIRLVRLAFASWKAVEKEVIAEDFLLQLLIQR